MCVRQTKGNRKNHNHINSVPYVEQTLADSIRDPIEMSLDLDDDDDDC